MPRRKFISLLIFVAFCSVTFYAYAYNLPKFFPFNKKNALGEWQEKIFKNKVLYSIEPTHEGGYLSAKSNKACSGIFYKIKFHPKEFPLISWKWKIVSFPKKNKDKNVKGGWLEKDDYAARVYVIFPSFIFTNTKAIEYIWDENLPEGTILTSPYWRNIKLIVIESGRKNIDQWATEERNIHKDYVLAFRNQPGNVGAIALMTDTDNTLSSAEALYKEIKVGYRK
ncbi:MAG: DUF3047 domain-containing protein [Candidatus Omnitrophota bacterium]|nr:DUF3047 domain-containing protein [Candidatus Omnitrophota bacterium]